MMKYVCTICGFIYDEAAGIPSADVPAGTRWEALPADWVCPLCGASKADFEPQAQPGTKTEQPPEEFEGELRKLTIAEMAALCSNLARGCEKQYLMEESALFTQLAEYFTSKTPTIPDASLEGLHQLTKDDLNQGFALANAVSKQKSDRGAQRALVWSEKVTRIVNSILTRYQSEGDSFLEHTSIYVCDTCGFIYVGDEPPALCPVCKVPGWKFTSVERR